MQSSKRSKYKKFYESSSDSESELEIEYKNAKAFNHIATSKVIESVIESSKEASKTLAATTSNKQRPFSASKNNSFGTIIEEDSTEDKSYSSPTSQRLSVVKLEDTKPENAVMEKVINYAAILAEQTLDLASSLSEGTALCASLGLPPPPEYVKRAVSSGRVRLKDDFQLEQDNRLEVYEIF
jgi:hypothetical protein